MIVLRFGGPGRRILLMVPETAEVAGRDCRLPCCDARARYRRRRLHRLPLRTPACRAGHRGRGSRQADLRRQPREPGGDRARVLPRRHRRPGCRREAAAGCDAIVNFAAETHVDRSILGPQEFVHTDVLGTMCLLEWARANDARYVQVSTDEVYGDFEAGGRAVENDPLRPSSPYSAAKAGGDLQVLAYCRTYGVRASITRGANTYGPNQYPEKLVPLFVTNALEGEPLPVYGDGKQVREWLHAEDHCAGIELVLHEGAPGEIYNVGGEDHENIEVTHRILELTGADPVADPPCRGSGRPRPPLRDRRRQAAGARLGAASTRSERAACLTRSTGIATIATGGSRSSRAPIAPTTTSSTPTDSRPDASYREQFGEVHDAPHTRSPSRPRPGDRRGCGDPAGASDAGARRAADAVRARSTCSRAAATATGSASTSTAPSARRRPTGPTGHPRLLLPGHDDRRRRRSRPCGC